MRSFVLGNGLSRLKIDINSLRPYGLIYGCNALYREFEPDYLIAVDAKMIFEIEKTGWQLTHNVWTNPNSKFNKFKGFNYFSPSLGWSSGPTALNLASEHSTDEIYILGFDYVGTPRGEVNNVYSGTDNYKKSNEQATYYGNWKRQTEIVIKKNINIKYYRVVDQYFYDPEFHFNNFSNITIESFQEKLNSFNKIR